MRWPGERHQVQIAQRGYQDGHANRWFLDPLLRGAYPDDLVALFEQRVGPVEPRPGDLTTIATPVDFLGISYYHPCWVQAAPAREPLALEHVAPPPPTSPIGWQIDPQGLRDLLARLAREYGRRPIWITENGIPDEAETPPGQGLEDHPRIDHLSAHLEALSAALADGADVRRYFVWSLLDSFEWELGHWAPAVRRCGRHTHAGRRLQGGATGSSRRPPRRASSGRSKTT